MNSPAGSTIGEAQKRNLAELLSEINDFHLTVPIDDLDAHYVFSLSVQEFVIRLQALATPILPAETARELRSISVEVGDLSSAAEARVKLMAIVPFVEDALSYVVSGSGETPANYEALWDPVSIRLFISHRDTVKVHAHKLASELEKYGIDSFVSHDDIEPDEDWKREIEKALASMDVMLAFISDDFFQSAWTNQEIGYALGLGVPVVSIKLDNTDPQGFIRNRQAILGNIDNHSQNARQIKLAIRKRLANRTRYRRLVLDRFIGAGSFIEAKDAFEDLQTLGEVTDDEVTQLVRAFNDNNQLHNCWSVIDGFIAWLGGMNIDRYIMHGDRIIMNEQNAEDDFPF